MAAAASEKLRPELAWLQHLVTQFPPVIEPTTVHRCAGGTHSRTRDGRTVCWNPQSAERVAVDAEIAAQEVPGALGRRWQCDEPETVWQWWTATEVAAKLSDQPILTWVSSAPPVTSNPCPTSVGQVWWTSTLTEDLRLTFGYLAPRSGEDEA